jgi:hypothetical protein
MSIGQRDRAGAEAIPGTRVRESAHSLQLSMNRGGHMDKGQKWGWLPSAMPGVARLMAEKRVQLGNEHVNTCWRRGVIDREPGWFFAREGALAVGTPWGNDPALANFAALHVTATQALLVIRTEPIGQ